MAVDSPNESPWSSEDARNAADPRGPLSGEAPVESGETGELRGACDEGESAAADGEGGDGPGAGLVTLSPAELVRAVEAVLFSAGEPIAIRALADLFGAGVHDVREAVEVLREEYIDTGRAFRVEDIAGGVQVLTLPAYDFWIRRLERKEREGRLSAAALETLAVIAYKQPITKADLEAIRGVQCGPILKTLMDRGMVQVVGKDESLGRPLLYGTTRLFLQNFGLASLKDLPQPESLPEPVGGGEE